MSSMAEINMQLDASASIICNDPSSYARLKEMERVLEAHLKTCVGLPLPHHDKTKNNSREGQ